MQHSLATDPMWDEGIASFLYGEHEKRRAPLSVQDLQQLAIDQAVRVGDMLETLFLMAIYGEWNYTDAAGKPLPLDESALNDLYAKGRLGPSDLREFPGLWSPAS